MNHSPLQKIRYAYEPKLPSAFQLPLERIAVEEFDAHAVESGELAALFPSTYGHKAVRFAEGAGKAKREPMAVGVILSGGQAPGGHNVIAGIFDGLVEANPASRLYGFKGGPGGLVKDSCVELTAAIIDEYRNTGGFDMIGSGRTKIETPEQFAGALATAKKRKLDAVVVIGGDDSNTNAALLAEFFAAKGERISVIGVPKTIDGDLKNEWIETSFGFDTATKTYSELIGNICRDACSARKYWHFIKLMGRSASHIALECGLKTRANVTLVSEEVAERGMSLTGVVDSIVSAVVKRAEAGLDFGVVLVPEGLIEFIPEMKALIAELNDIMAANDEIASSITSGYERADYVAQKLSAESKAAFASLPREIRSQLVMDRDPHGNVQVSRIDTEMLLIDLVSAKLEMMAEAGTYDGSFSAQHHFFGYEGRCAFPSNFDADYCYSLGYAAFLLFANGLSGYLASVRGLDKPSSEWIGGGIPLVAMMNMEKRHGEFKPVIKKALVDLEGKPFMELASHRESWAVDTAYLYPGAIQYFGPAEVCDAPTITLALELSERR